MYARACVDLVDEDDTSEVAVPEGERAMFVYPMLPHGDTVRMRVKRVDAVTGQLSYSWVVVYCPLTDERRVLEFTLLP